MRCKTEIRGNGLFRSQNSECGSRKYSKMEGGPDVVSAYKSDPLVHDRVSTRFFTELIDTMDTVRQQASLLQVPILMQVAGDDHLVDAQTAGQFFEKLVVPDKTLHVYEGLYHEIYNESEAQRKPVLKDLEKWLEKRL